jgi:1,4-dihydroxy-2-naphthoate octaprenyltransferase
MSATTLTEKFLAWIKISRLQFFPMTWLAYTLGSVLNRVVSHQWDLSLYLLGYLVIFLIELCAIYVNEYYDFKSDVVNRNYSPFTGGSRVLVEGKLRETEVIVAIRILMVLVLAAGYLLANRGEMDSLFSIYFLVAVGLFLGLGYTMPPLKFCYRGVGELIVGSTHSFYVILCGFIFQGGSWSNPLPWLLGVPLFFAILAGIFLAGVPDREADYAAGKKTFAVLAGSRSATIVAMAFVLLSSLTALLLFINKVINLSPIYWALLIVPHALIFIYALWKLLQSNLFDRRIDGVMIISLTYILWFGLLPFISLFIRP